MPTKEPTPSGPTSGPPSAATGSAADSPSAGFMSRQTLVPMGTVIAVVIFLATPVLWFINMADEVTDQLSDFSRRMESMEKKVDEIAGTRMTTGDFKVWLRLFQTENPSIKVPELMMR